MLSSPSLFDYLKLCMAYKQLELFPELAMKLTSTLDELSLDYIKQHYYPEFSEEDARQAFKDGVLAVLGEIIDIIKKYTDLHEN